MALVAGNEDYGRFLGHAFYSVETVFIDCNPFKHGVQDPCY